jgi:hypothetical protein
MPETDLSNPDLQLAMQFVNQTARPVFLTGKAGTGKTTFLKYLRAHTAKKTVILAPTGVAAMHAGGVTVHAFFQLPFAPFLPGSGPVSDPSGSSVHGQTLLKNIRFSAAKRDLLQELDLLVIDEVSMLRADMLDAIDTILRFYRNRRQPFGGVQLLLIGDLYQLPPVVGKTEWDMLGRYYQSPFFFDAWSLKDCPLVYISLKKIYRQQDMDFIQLLNSIRDNAVTGEELDRLNRHHDPAFQPPPGEPFITLTTHNARADAINATELQKLPGPDYVFEAELKGDFDPRSVIADSRLLLRPGAQVMLVRNDKGEQRRYYNGKIGRISRISREEIAVSFPGEAGDLVLEKETWKNIRYRYNREKGTVEEETAGSFTQYPVRLAWAITIHKSQGLTFGKAIIDAAASFAPGQVYVALSRLISLNGLVLYSRIHSAGIRTDPQVIRFSREAEAASGKLQERLQQDRADYTLRLIEEAFRWEKLLSVFRDHHQTYGKDLVAVNDRASAWAKEMLDRMKEEAVVGTKFEKQLGTLLLAAKDHDYDALRNRIEAACHYFLNALDGLLASVEKRKTESGKKSGARKYLKALAILEKALMLKKQQLRQALRMGRGLADGLELHELFEPEPMVTPGENSVPGKPKKGESQRISLELFREKKSLAEIARLRGLALSTIENHLAAFVATGEIGVRELVAEEKIRPILEILRQTNDRQLAAIREKLGPAYSYFEIKAVIHAGTGTEARDPDA